MPSPREAICNLRAKIMRWFGHGRKWPKGVAAASSRRSSCLNEEAANRGSLYANGKSSVENHEVKTTFARRLDQFRIGTPQ
jgi:hypothetical protein